MRPTVVLPEPEKPVMKMLLGWRRAFTPILTLFGMSV